MSAKAKSASAPRVPTQASSLPRISTGSTMSRRHRKSAIRDFLPPGSRWWYPVTSSDAETDPGQ